MNFHSDSSNTGATVLWDSGTAQNTDLFMSLRTISPGCSDNGLEDDELSYPDFASTVPIQAPIQGLDHDNVAGKLNETSYYLHNLLPTEDPVHTGINASQGSQSTQDSLKELNDNISSHRVIVRPMSPMRPYNLYDSEDDDVEIIDGNTIAIAGLGTIPWAVTNEAVRNYGSDEDASLYDGSLYNERHDSLFDGDGNSSDKSGSASEDGESGGKLVDDIVNELLKACEGKGSTRLDDEYDSGSEGDETHDDETDSYCGDNEGSVSLGDRDTDTDDSDEEDSDSTATTEEDSGTDDSGSDTESEDGSSSGESEYGAGSSVDGEHGIYKVAGKRKNSVIFRPLKRRMDPDDVDAERTTELKRLRGDHPALNTPVIKAESYIQAVTPLGYGKVIQSYNYLTDELPGYVPRDEYRSILLRMNRTAPKRFA